MYDTAGATCSFDLVEGFPDWLPLIVALLETYGFLVWMPFYCRYAAEFCLSASTIPHMVVGSWLLVL